MVPFIKRPPAQRAAADHGPLSPDGDNWRRRPAEQHNNMQGGPGDRRAPGGGIGRGARSGENLVDHR